MQSRGRRSLLLLLSILISLNCVGCWDLWELEDRGMVMAIGIDEIDETQLLQSGGLENELLGDVSDRAVKVVYQFAIPSGLSGEQSSGGPTYYNMIATSLNSEILIRGLAGTRSSRRGDLTHLLVMVLGQEAAKKGIYPILERYIRDPDVRKQMMMIVTDGDVAKVLEINNQQEPMPAIYITTLMENSNYIQRIPPSISLMEVFRHILEEGVYIIPKITPGKNDLKLAGGGIFHGDRLVGWLGEMETVIYRWIVNEMTASPIVTASPSSTAHKLVDGYLAERSNTMVRTEIQDGTIKFILKIKTEGSLLERQLAIELWNDEITAAVRQEMANALAEDIRLLINKAQEEWQLDIFGFGRYIEQYHPQVWKEIKDQWHDTYFPGAQFEIDVDVTITRTGIVS